ncbi:PAS domain-containing sensor histidine kinase [Fibrella arboris]|uniref:PAS domain-containing sensor histidine kinase n=1 Tax=Fibrella arboris TaxID=3242486 RepID=UPI003520EA2D
MNRLFSPDSLRPDAVRKATLVLEVTHHPTLQFRVRQGTVTDKGLDKGIAMLPVGATLDQLPTPFNLPALIDQLEQALSQPLLHTFQLEQPCLPAGSCCTYACELLQVEANLLVLTLELLPDPEKPTALADIVETMPTGLIVFRAIRNEDREIVDFQAMLCNQFGARIVGQSREAILTQPISQRYANMKEYAFFHQYVAVVESGTPHSQLMHLPTLDLWLDVSVVKYGDGMLVSFQDVTDGQQTASLLASVMNSSPAAIRYYEAIRDATGQIIDFMTGTGNELAAYRDFRPYPSTTGRRLLELYPQLKTNGLFDRYIAVVESGKSDRFETTHEGASQTSWFDSTVVPHGNGFVITNLDITSFKQAQLAQQGQSELITGVLDSSVSSIIVLSPIYGEDQQVADFRIDLANPATQTLFARFIGQEFAAHETIQNQTMGTLFPAVRERDLFRALMAVVKTETPIYHTVDYPQLGITYDYAITPFQTGVLLITTDITPIRAYQQQLEAHNAALSRSNEYLQQFAYVASHDLQEPLRKIYSFGDLLRKQYTDALDDTGRDLLQRMQNAAIRMQTLVKDLLDYSRLTTLQVSLQPVSLQALLQDTLDDLETTIRDTNATITIEGDGLPVIPGDKTQLRQLLQNLIANALKFTRPGQPPQVRVTVDLLRADQLPLSVPATASQQWVSLRIADQGIGFDEVYQERIFELFHRLHGRSKYTGTGIGLAVVKKVVENHTGQITATSQPGAGAAFTVYLPLA